MITVKFFTSLQLLVGRSEVKVDRSSATVAELIYLCEKYTSNSITEKVLNNRGQLLPEITVLKDGKNIKHLDGLNTELLDGQQLSIFPSVGGG